MQRIIHGSAEMLSPAKYIGDAKGEDDFMINCRLDVIFQSQHLIVNDE